jgi:hypothetical protein
MTFNLFFGWVFVVTASIFVVVGMGLLFLRCFRSSMPPDIAQQFDELWTPTNFWRILLMVSFAGGYGMHWLGII